MISCQSENRESDSHADDDQTTWQEKFDGAELDDSTIRSTDGTVLLHIDDFPANIRVDEDSEFGASGRLMEFSAAPDYEWFAVVTSGAAHSGGWLLRTGTTDPQPASFQYGGNLLLGPWSEDSQYIVFIHEGPAGDTTLSVAKRDLTGETVEENTTHVRIPEHDDLHPEDRIYEGERWENAQLLFTAAGSSWIFDAEDGSVTEAR